MRIFNWMHRKFHHKDGKKGEHLAGNYCERETQVLLEQVTLANVLDGWRDGILTIGTFGFDPLTHFKLECPSATDFEKVVEEEYAFDNNDSEDHEKEEDEDQFDAKEYCDDEDQELNPLVFGCGSDNQDSSGSIYDYDHDNIINALNLKAAAADHPTTRPIYQFGNFKYSKFSSDEDEKQYYKKRERTTLADLFLADSSDAAAANTKLQHHHVAAAQGQKQKKRPPNHPTKGLSFAQKLENPRPVKKLQQLMRRMMKRKIHPDLEGLIQKGDAQIKPTTAEEEYGGIECIRFPSSN